MHPPSHKQLSQKLSVDTNTLLGKGSTGNVYKGLCLEPQPHPVAVKVIPLEEVNNQVTKYLLECELQALKSASRCPNESIVKLEQITVIDNNVYIATELLEGGTLKDFITQSKKIQPAKALYILQRVLQGYKILKDNRIIHRDLKPDNIIFTVSPHTGTIEPKIIDFGYCIVENVQNKPKMYYNVGSPRYMSPQAYTNNKYSEKSDIWSLGIVFYEMLTGTNFDKGKNIVETFKLIKQKGIPIPSSLNPQCRGILQHMLMLDPNKRYTCEDVLKEITLGPQSQPQGQNNFNSPSSNSYQLNQIGMQSRNMREFKNSVINQQRVLSPENRPPMENRTQMGARASFLNAAMNSPLRGSFLLTRSVGFVVSPQAQQGRLSVFNSNQFNSRVERSNMMNRSFNDEYRQGHLTDRNKTQDSKQTIRLIKTDQKPGDDPNKGAISIKINKTLPASSSQQNLHRVLTEGNQIINNQQNSRRRQNIIREKQQMFVQPAHNQQNQGFPFRPEEAFRGDRMLTTPTSNKFASNINNSPVPFSNQPPPSFVHFFKQGQPIVQQRQLGQTPPQIHINAQPNNNQQIQILPPQQMQNPHQQIIQTHSNPQQHIQIQQNPNQQQIQQIQQQMQPQMLQQVHIQPMQQVTHSPPQQQIVIVSQTQPQQHQMQQQPPSQPQQQIQFHPPDKLFNKNIKIIPMTPHGDPFKSRQVMTNQYFVMQPQSMNFRPRTIEQTHI